MFNNLEQPDSEIYGSNNIHRSTFANKFQRTVSKFKILMAKLNYLFSAKVSIVSKEGVLRPI